MQDRRKGFRLGLESSIVINRIDEVDNEEITIDIIDVSKTGIGFTSKQNLQMGSVYESYLKIWTKESIHAYLQITRIEQKDDLYEYGAFFVGMPEMDSARIANYGIIEQTVKEMEENE